MANDNRNTDHRGGDGVHRDRDNDPDPGKHGERVISDAGVWWLGRLEQHERFEQLLRLEQRERVKHSQRIILGVGDDDRYDDWR